MAFDENGNLVPNPIPASVVLGQTMSNESSHPVLSSLNEEIARLQKEVFENRGKMRDYIQTVKDVLIDVHANYDGDVDTIVAIADQLDIELTQTVSVEKNVTLNIDIEVPFGTTIDLDNLEYDLDISVDSMSMTVTDFSVDHIYTIQTS